jgi:oligoribonuclease
MKNNPNLVWIDLEMTGLNPLTDEILEVAMIVTNAHLEILAEGPIIVIHQPEEVLTAMDSWNTEHHGQSGLIEMSRKSSYNCRQAELECLAFMRQWTEYRTSPMCGNSVYHDRRFLARFMPELEQFFHHRNIDVSTIKELARLWAPDHVHFHKECGHRALDDIKESIDELKYYGDCFIKKAGAESK